MDKKVVIILFSVLLFTYMKSFSVFSTKAFTLIELLVVISIIGLLSSVVLASLTTTRTKAKLAAGKQFDTSNYHAYGADAYTLWSMDQASLGADSSGNSLNLTTNGTPTVVPGVFGNAVNFNASTDFLSLTIPATSGLSTINQNGGTVSMWIRQTTGGQGAIVFTGYSSGSNRMYIQVSGDVAIVTRGAGACGATCGTPISLGPIKAGEWNHVALSWTGSGTMKGYYNGQKIGEATFTPGVAPDTLAGVTIGRQSDLNAFSGDVDEVRMFGNILADSQIRSMYLAEAPVVKRLVVQEK